VKSVENLPKEKIDETNPEKTGKLKSEYFSFKEFSLYLGLFNYSTQKVFFLRKYSLTLFLRNEKFRLDK